MSKMPDSQKLKTLESYFLDASLNRLTRPEVLTPIKRLPNSDASDSETVDLKKSRVRL